MEVLAIGNPQTPYLMWPCTPNRDTFVILLAIVLDDSNIINFVYVLKTILKANSGLVIIAYKSYGPSVGI